MPPSRALPPTLLLLTALAASCMPAQSPGGMQKDNPLGPSFWLIPTPSDDDALLGRSFQRPPDTALTLEEQSQPNPCADKLAPKKDASMPNQYENAIDVKASASGGAMLGQYGFSADAQRATHLVYKVATTKRVAQMDTTDYVTCCKQANCGWGYVSALIYGEGDYSSAQEGSTTAGVTYTVVATAKGKTSFAVLNKRSIKGYVAAVLTAHDRNAAAQACPPGQQWGATECVTNERVQMAQAACRGAMNMGPSMGPPAGAEPGEGGEGEGGGGKKDENAGMAMMQQQACMWLDMHKLPH